METVMIKEVITNMLQVEDFTSINHTIVSYKIYQQRTTMNNSAMA